MKMFHWIWLCQEGIWFLRFMIDWVKRVRLGAFGEFQVKVWKGPWSEKITFSSFRKHSLGWFAGACYHKSIVVRWVFRWSWPLAWWWQSQSDSLGCPSQPRPRSPCRRPSVPSSGLLCCAKYPPQCPKKDIFWAKTSLCIAGCPPACSVEYECAFSLCGRQRGKLRYNDTYL